MSNIIGAVDRALDIIIYLYQEGREKGISEMARDLDLHKSTVHRNLITLENKGFVYQNNETGKYWLGMKFFAIGMVVGDNLSLTKVIEPFTKALYDEFHEVINVSVLDSSNHDLKSIIIHKEENQRQVLMVNPPVGSSSECHCSSVGKCLLAFNKDLDLESYRDLPLRKYTDKTIDNWDDLIKELEQVKLDGYALDDEELERGLTCIGAPILDRSGTAVAAISLSGPTQRMKDGTFEYKIQRVKEIANLISSHIK